MKVTPIIWFCIIGASTLIVMVPHYIISFLNNIKEREPMKIEQFIVSEYFNRMEKTALDILDEQKKVDKVIILWWGFDGLRLNEDGSLEWISRKKPGQVKQNVFYQSVQSIEQGVYPLYNLLDMRQSTAENTILQMQAAQSAQNMAMISTLNSCVLQYSHSPRTQYLPYLYIGCGGGGAGYDTGGGVCYGGGGRY